MNEVWISKICHYEESINSSKSNVLVIENVKLRGTNSQQGRSIYEVFGILALAFFVMRFGIIVRHPQVCSPINCHFPVIMVIL